MTGMGLGCGIGLELALGPTLEPGLGFMTSPPTVERDELDERMT